MSEESLPDIPMLAEVEEAVQAQVQVQTVEDNVVQAEEQVKAVEEIQAIQIQAIQIQAELPEQIETKTLNIEEKINTVQQHDLKLKDLVDNLKLNFHTPTDIVKVIANGIKYAEKYINLTGKEKKALVMEAVNLIIASSDLSEEAKETVKNITNIVADPVVDSLVEFGNDAIILVKSKVKALIERLKNLNLKTCFCLSSSSNITPDVPVEVVNELTKLLNEKIEKFHLFTTTEVKPDIIVLLMSDAVKFMADKKTIVGLAKKGTVLSVTRNIIRSSEHFNQQDKKYLIDIVDTIGSTFIDAATGIKF
jgi:hypothetical protein